jgi:5-formyltetrahydrofolate cyclo-ligase
VASEASRIGTGGGRACRYYERALSIWPRLDRRALSRCACDPQRIARVVARRTSLPMEAILALIVGPTVSRVEMQTWFG